ncbi:MAG: alpha/beta fold hydrolase [Acidimicrobiales bacterium]
MSRFESFDGIEIAFHEFGEGDGIPVLLHHGFAADTATNWGGPGIVAALVTDGRRVIGIDARGHGESDKPHDSEAYRSPAMASDVSALLDHLGLDQVDLVGYSMGGFVSLEVATREARLRSLVVGGIGGGAIPGADGSGPAIDRSAVADAMEADDPSGASPAARSFRALADATGADRIALAAVLRSSTHGTRDLSVIACPTTVIAGDTDPLARGADRLAEAIPGARFVSVPGDHLGAVGAEEFTAAILEHLRTLDAG